MTHIALFSSGTSGLHSARKRSSLKMSVSDWLSKRTVVPTARACDDLVQRHTARGYGASTAPRMSSLPRVIFTLVLWRTGRRTGVAAFKMGHQYSICESACGLWWAYPYISNFFLACGVLICQKDLNPFSLVENTAALTIIPASVVTLKSEALVSAWIRVAGYLYCVT